MGNDRPRLFHQPTHEEVFHTGYRVSDSEVTDAIRVLRMYGGQVMEDRGKLYWDAKKRGDEPSAAIHLQKYQSAHYLQMECESLEKWYRDSK